MEFNNKFVPKSGICRCQMSDNVNDLVRVSNIDVIIRMANWTCYASASPFSLTVFKRPSTNKIKPGKNEVEQYLRLFTFVLRRQFY